MPLAKALYYAQEAKIFGEQASGVGYTSDIYIMRAGQQTRKLTRGSVKALDTVWNLIKPGELSPKQSRELSKLREVRNVHVRRKPKKPGPKR